MNFRCSELQGALHQPTEILEIDDCWVIPACKGGAVLQASDSKLVFVSREETSKDNHLISEYLFVCCYQFLFFNYCNIYRFYALRQINIQENFFLDGEDINN